MHERKDGLLGDGCKNCPVESCQTLQYRGSTCTAQRAKCGVTEDPYSWGDKIRSEDNEYIAKQLYNFFVGGMKTMAEAAGFQMPDVNINQAFYLQVVEKQLDGAYNTCGDEEFESSEKLMRSDIEELERLMIAAKDGRSWIAPCKPGQTVFFVNSYLKALKPVAIVDITINGNGIAQYGCTGPFDYSPTYLEPDELGETWFLTREAAMQKLNSIKENTSTKIPVPKEE